MHAADRVVVAALRLAGEDDAADFGLVHPEAQRLGDRRRREAAGNDAAEQLDSVEVADLVGRQHADLPRRPVDVVHCAVPCPVDGTIRPAPGLTIYMVKPYIKIIIQQMSVEMPRAYVLHENDAWVEPLRAAFAEQDVPFEEWFLAKAPSTSSAAPPEGVFYNRMSASSHTRGHRYGPELTAVVLAWLERHGRRVVNDSRALQLEISKAAQYAPLSQPASARRARSRRSAARHIVDARGAFTGSVHHQAQPRRQRPRRAAFPRRATRCRRMSRATRSRTPVDGITLHPGVHQARRSRSSRASSSSAANSSTRCASTPRWASSCARPTHARSATRSARRRRRRSPPRRASASSTASITDRRALPQFIAANGIGIAGIEFIVDAHGEIYTYDVNTNTNYNPDAEARGRHLRHARDRTLSGRGAQAHQPADHRAGGPRGGLMLKGHAAAHGIAPSSLRA